MDKGIRSEYGNILIGDFSDIADYTPIHISPDYSGTESEPITIWAGGGAEVDTYTLGNYKYLHYTRGTGSDPSGSNILIMNGSEQLYLFLLKYTDYTRLLLIWGNSEANAKSIVTNGNWTRDNILYQNTNSAAESWLEDLMEWDDAPSTDEDNDPFNENPQGGEFADRDDFRSTELQYLADLDEPETIDYGAFLTAYELDYTNLSALGAALFDTSFWTSLKNKFEGLSDPMSFIISAVEIPFRLGVAVTNFKLGGIAVTTAGGAQIPCWKHTSRYFKYDFGTITLKEVWGTAKDYTDCDISIFLPYVGMRQIDPDLAVNSQLSLTAIIDVWTGDLNYMMQINNSTMQNKYYASSGVPYRWSGNCGNRIPIGKVDPSSPILNVASSLGSMLVGAGMMIAGGAVGGPAGAAAGAAAGSAMMGGAGASTLMGGVKSLTNDINNGFSPLAQSSGNISGAIGYMDYQYPYLVIKRGVPKYPNNWRSEFGAPRYQAFRVGSLNGYTEFADIHADDVSGASDDEKRMIEDILKDGIII